MGRATLDEATFEGMDALHEAAAQLCRDYATVEPAVLRERGRELFTKVTSLTRESRAENDRRELMVVAGWASLLTACVEYDMNLADDAECSRRTAAWMGRESGHDEIVAWAFEIGAWFALASRRWRETIELAVAGQRIAPDTSAAAQLAAQEARAWARLGERGRSAAALERIDRVLDLLPSQREANHHFVMDESKADFYRLDCHRWLGDDHLTERYAQAVLARCDRPAVLDHRKPMRVAGARLSLGVVAARGGDLVTATEAALAALAEDRRSLPWFSLVASELVDAVLVRWPRDPRTRDLVESIRAVAPEALPANRC